MLLFVSAGSSILDMSPFDRETYTNSEAIAISQDPCARQGYVVWQDCPPFSFHKVPQCAQVWAKPLCYNGSFALVFVNFAQDVPKPRIVSCEGVCMERACGPACASDTFAVRDVWKKVETVSGSVQVALQNGASSMFVVTPIKARKEHENFIA
jgi:hypothetical protein